SFAQHHSDHLTLNAAFQAYLAVKKRGRAAESQFCSEKFLSRPTLRAMIDLRKQFAEQARAVIRFPFSSLLFSPDEHRDAAAAAAARTAGGDRFRARSEADQRTGLIVERQRRERGD